MESAYDGRGDVPATASPLCPLFPRSEVLGSQCPDVGAWMSVPSGQCSRNIGHPLPGSMCECSAPFADSRVGYVPVAASDPAMTTV